MTAEVNKRKETKVDKIDKSKSWFSQKSNKLDKV